MTSNSSIAQTTLANQADDDSFPGASDVAINSIAIAEKGEVAPAHPPRAVKPLLTIRATSGWVALDLAELWHFRDLILTLAARDVKLRYRQTALGVIWVVLQPLISAGVFSFIFGKVANLPSDNVPYFLFAYAGLMGWNAFNSTVSKVNGSMISNAHLITKVYFPRPVLALSTLISTLIDFAVSMVLMCVLLAIHRHDITIGPGLLLLPIWLLLLIGLAMGIGLLSAAWSVRYRDIGNVLSVGLQFLMMLSPVVYTASRVPERYRAAYFLNPASGLLEAFRWSLLGRTEVHWAYLWYSVSASLLFLIAGAFVFKRMERGFVDVI